MKKMINALCFVVVVGVGVWAVMLLLSSLQLYCGVK